MTPAGHRPRAVVLVSGSGSNLQAIIDAAASGEVAADLRAVISDRPGAYALERAGRAGIPGIVVDYGASRSRPAFDAALATALDALAPDIVVLAGFMRILETGLVERYRGRMLNVHPALLPRFPGLHTYRRVLESGDAWHGTTVHFVIPALDAGPSVIQYRIPVRPGDTEASLRERVLRGEHAIYPRAVAWLASGRLVLRADRPHLDGRPLDEPLVVDEGLPRERWPV